MIRCPAALTAIAACAAALLPITASRAETVNQFNGTEPLVLLDDNHRVSACGVRMLVTLDGTALAIDLGLQRSEPEAQFVLRAAYREPAQGLLPVTKVEIKTSDATSNDILLNPGYFDGSGALVLAAGADHAGIAPLMQSLMVGGATLTIAREFLLETNTLTVPGPLPQNVRAQYLACAGDLVGPKP